MKLLPIAAEMREAVPVPIACQPVAYQTPPGRPDFTSLPEFPFSLDPLQLPRAAMAEFAVKARELGIGYVGSCCGSVAVHVRAMARALGKASGEDTARPRRGVHGGTDRTDPAAPPAPRARPSRLGRVARAPAPCPPTSRTLGPSSVGGAGAPVRRDGADPASSRRERSDHAVHVHVSFGRGFVLALAVGGMLASGLSGPAAAPVRAADPLVLRVGTTQDLDSLNPFQTALVVGYEAFTLNYDTLVGWGSNLETIPGFASSWTQSADGLSWTFAIDPNLKWSDGTPATLEDARWTLQFILDAVNAGKSVGLGYLDPYVKDAGITKIEAPDPQTLVLTTDHPNNKVLQMYIPSSRSTLEGRDARHGRDVHE